MVPPDRQLAGSVLRFSCGPLWSHPTCGPDPLNSGAGVPLSTGPALRRVAMKPEDDIVVMLEEQGAERRALGERLRAERDPLDAKLLGERSRKEVDRHYQKMADAEAERIRASVPDSPPVIKPQGVCVCGRDIIRFGRGWAHMDYTATHPAEPAKGK